MSDDTSLADDRLWPEYERAFAEWDESEDAALWDMTTGDGVS